MASVAHGLTGKLSPQRLANHRAQLFPRPSLECRQQHPTQLSSERSCWTLPPLASLQSSGLSE